jgi:hypothetical protein
MHRVFRYDTKVSRFQGITLPRRHHLGARGVNWWENLHRRTVWIKQNQIDVLSRHECFSVHDPDERSL